MGEIEAVGRSEVVGRPKLCGETLISNSQLLFLTCGAEHNTRSRQSSRLRCTFLRLRESRLWNNNPKTSINPKIWLPV